MKQPAVIFPDPAAAAITYLVAELAARAETYAAATVRDRNPDAMPDLLVTVRDDGGRRDGVAKECALALNVYATSHADCADLARLAVAILEDAPGNGTAFVEHVGTVGPYLVPEQGTHVHRYAVVTLTILGTAL